MKKALIYGLSAALLLASLTACNKPQANQQNTELNPTQAAASTQEPEETVTLETNPEPLSDTIPAAHDETDTSQPPEESSPVEQAPEVQLFTDANETVYATSTVNIRESWSASSTRLGSLSAGQSVTRTGTSIASTEAEGWSRVQLSDGTTAYISDSYLSTTKPVQQQSTTPSTPSSSSSSSNQSTTTTSQPSTETTSSSSGHSGSHWNQAFYDTLTPDQKAMYESFSDASRKAMEVQVQSNREAEAQGWHTTVGDDQITQEDRDNLIDGLNGN